MTNNIEQIEVTVSDNYKIIFAVDHDLFDEKVKDWHSLNDFWSNAEDRLCLADNNIIDAVLGYLAQVCFQLQVAEDLNTYGVMDEFKDMEGWPPMDGSFGILIKHIDKFEFDFRHDCDIKKTKISEMPSLPKGNF